MCSRQDFHTAFFFKDIKINLAHNLNIWWIVKHQARLLAADSQLSGSVPKMTTYFRECLIFTPVKSTPFSCLWLILSAPLQRAQYPGAAIWQENAALQGSCPPGEGLVRLGC